GLTDRVVVDHRLLELRFVYVHCRRQGRAVADRVKVPAVERQDVRRIAEGPASNPFPEAEQADALEAPGADRETSPQDRRRPGSLLNSWIVKRRPVERR